MWLWWSENTCTQGHIFPSFASLMKLSVSHRNLNPFLGVLKISSAAAHKLILNGKCQFVVWQPIIWVNKKIYIFYVCKETTWLKDKRATMISKTQESKTWNLIFFLPGEFCGERNLASYSGWWFVEEMTYIGPNIADNMRMKQK